ncbi:MAG: hypothetical protein LBP92_11595 [Deltaproteobacteria bacterium]|nr:hypothetical protein [Deltaproteobacteria bacterium]
MDELANYIPSVEDEIVDAWNNLPSPQGILELDGTFVWDNDLLRYVHLSKPWRRHWRRTGRVIRTSRIVEAKDIHLLDPYEEIIPEWAMGKDFPGTLPVRRQITYANIRSDFMAQGVDINAQNEHIRAIHKQMSK